MAFVLVLFSASGLVALGWEKADTDAYNHGVVVTSELDQAVDLISHNICYDGGFLQSCSDVLSCAFSSTCQTNHNYYDLEGACTDLVVGHHRAQLYGVNGADIDAESLDYCP